MKDQIKSFLNEDQDPKALEKIMSKLDSLIMQNETIGYIGVQKKPAITVFPDSVVLTNKRIILCKPKNLGLSMDFVDYDWGDIAGTFVKENILGSEFSFSTQTGLVISIDYVPKNQAKKLYTFAKEQLELLKNPLVKTHKEFFDTAAVVEPKIIEEVEEIIPEEVTHFAELMPLENRTKNEESAENNEKKLNDLTQDELFAKLQNYKKLLDNGLILQVDYDRLKAEILLLM